MNYSSDDRESLNICSQHELTKHEGKFEGTKICLRDLPEGLHQKLISLIKTGKIKTLSLQACFANSQQLYDVLLSLGQNKNIKKLRNLDIRRNAIDDDCVTEISRLFFEKKTLRVLRLPAMDKMCTEHLLKSVCRTKLESMNISGSCLSKLSVDILCDILRNRNITDALNLENCVALRGKMLSRLEKELITEAEKRGRIKSIGSIQKVHIKWFTVGEDRLQSSSETSSYREKGLFGTLHVQNTSSYVEEDMEEATGSRRKRSYTERRRNGVKNLSSLEPTNLSSDSSESLEIPYQRKAIAVNPWMREKTGMYAHLGGWRDNRRRRWNDDSSTSDSNSSETDEARPYRKRVITMNQLKHQRTAMPPNFRWFRHWRSRKYDDERLEFSARVPSNDSADKVLLHCRVRNSLKSVITVSFAIFQKQRYLKLCLWDPKNDKQAQHEMNTLLEDDYTFMLRSEVTMEDFIRDIIVSLRVTEPEKYLLSLEENRTGKHFIELKFVLPDESITEDKLEITYELHDESGKFYIA